MYGLKAIGEANGWSMAILGATIVFTGLVALSIVISQLHKVLDLWEKYGWTYFQRKSSDRKNPLDQKNRQNKSENTGEDFQEQTYPHPFICPTDIKEIAEIWEPLIDQIDTPFHLADLHELARKHNFPHPHLTINRLRSANVLVPIGEGLFEWNADAIEKG